MSVKKQIEASCRNKIAKQYTSRIKDLESRLRDQLELTHELRNKLRIQEDKISELNTELEQYKDWVSRLQEFMDLPEDAKEVAMNKFKVELETSNRLKKLMDSPLMRMYNSIINM